MTRATLTIAVASAWAATASAVTFPPNIKFQRFTIHTGDGPSAVAVGDFNGDGHLDLAFVNANGNSVATDLGDGHGNFFHAPNSPRATDAAVSIAATVGDFNGDGKLDVVATTVPGGLGGLWNSITGSGVGGEFALFLGQGNGALGSHDDHGLDASLPTAIAVGDFNGDGKLDVATTNMNSNNVAVRLGHGDGSFSDPVHFTVGHRPTSLAVWDFDGDGWLDLAVANSTSDTVTILHGNVDADGHWSFAARETIAVHSRPVAVAAGDFDGDGNGDLAVAGNLSSTVIVLFGDGTGSFPASTTLAAARQPSAVLARDFNNDGKLDIAVLNKASDSVAVLLGNGDRSFKMYRSFGVETQPVALAAGDFDEDGKLDLAVANLGSDTISVLLNTTDLTPPTLTMPVLAPSYVYNSTLTLTFGATDAESGIFSVEATLNGAPVVNGQTVLLNHPATNTFTLTDNVGNVATGSATFAVLYDFGGFLSPVPNDGSGIFRLRSVVPIRFQLRDANGAGVSNADARLKLQKLSGGTPVGVALDATAPGNVSTGNQFSYSAASNTYSYNLDTSPLSVGTWQIQVSLNDGSVHAVAIGLK